VVAVDERAPDEPASRRTLLGRGGAALFGLSALGLSGLGLSGCGGGGKSVQSSVKHAAQPVRSGDVELLNRLLDLERHTVAAYTAGIPLLSHPEAKTARQFLDEELEHTGELLSLIKAAGGPPIDRRPSYDLGQPRSAADVLTLLHTLERTQIAAYLAAIPQLSPGVVRAAAATILTSDAQHVAIIRLAQGEVAAPTAFVSGHE
jgi:hypothetical protein